ncbi:uncharacterized protein LOC131044423 isoform X2 [Cryptomeria japonica]|nr:uncharacterized protein LOC131044423 isoform X2 [Cryptomeria japonica]
MCGMVRSSSWNGSETAVVVSDGPKVEGLNEQEDVWCCLNCTYDNLKNLSACDMCGMTRLSSLTDGSKDDQSEGQRKIWRCQICTYDNPEQLFVCNMCGIFRSVSFKDIQMAPPGAEAISIPSSTASNTSFVIPTKAPAASSTIKVNNSNGKAKNTDNGVHRNDGSSAKGKILEELQTLNFSSSSTVQKSNVNMNKSLSMEEYKPEPWILQEQSDMGKNLLHLAIVGHVDAGKSTLMGRFLYIMGRVSQKEMHKYEREAKQKGKGSFSYAWVLDESPEERERGVTMTVAVAHFETHNFHVVLLDSPGHKDFVPNMIVGASQADAAVLVVDASLGAFEAGMDGQGIGGQTKEHAQLIRSFGVEQLIVAVNKMDAIAYSKERFDFIKSQLGTFLRRCGFKESSLTWIPMSVIENQNLVVSPTDERLKSWYKGPHLLEAIDLFKLPTRDTYRPLRLPISEVIQSRTLGQVAVSGKLEAGAIKIGTKVLVMPLAEVATVKAIEQDGKVLNIAKAGDSVDIGLQGIDSSILMPGGVLCHPDFPVPVARCIELKVAVLDIRKPILFGAEVELHAHHAKESARVAEILAILDPKTGIVRKKAPRCLTANQSALIQISPRQGICVEEYSNYKALGRVTLRADGKTIAVGVVTRIIEQQ